MILTITLNPALDKVYLIDDFKPNNIFRTNNKTETAGGKGLNVARVLKLMGEDVIATGFIGGYIGEHVKEQVKTMGIQEKFVQIADTTRTCINITDKQNNNTTEILEEGPKISSYEIDQFFNKYELLVENLDIIIASGSLPRGLPNDFYKKIIEIANKKNIKFILDTSGISLKEGIKGKPYLIKPNESEILDLLENKKKLKQAYFDILFKFKKQGIKLPIISLGANGCYSLIKNGVYHFIPPKVNTINSVGSGDSFIAGCAIAINNSLTNIEVIKLGMACGIANTQFLKTGMISKNMVNNFVEKIKVKKL